MCGITGIVDMRGERPIDESLLRAMNGVIGHRGPDGDGFHFEPGVGFGHRRLSIIDLEGGKQPLYNEDHTVVVTYNGEIFNFMEVERELLQRGHTFRTRSDTEVIVHAWEEWGVECLKRFNGMFAFAVWDRRAKTLFIARDRLGVKPLYYAELADGRLIFGSELKALLLHPQLQRRIDPQAVEEYFAFGYVPDPKTIYRDVKKLEPGAYICMKRGDSHVKPVRYWDVPLDGERAPGQPAAAWEEELRARLKEAVRKRLVSDVPLGAFLSGGIDSSAVVAMMREIGAGHILTCSIGFDEPRYDELEHARRVAEHFGTDHHEFVVKPDAVGILDRLIAHFDEPFADSSAIPTWYVSEMARRHVTVVLSGDGGNDRLVGDSDLLVAGIVSGPMATGFVAPTATAAGLTTPTSVNVVSFDSLLNTLDLDAGVDSLNGGAGDDDLIGDNAVSVLAVVAGGDGIGSQPAKLALGVVFEQLLGDINADAASDTLLAGEGNDCLIGDNQIDVAGLITGAQPGDGFRGDPTRR